MSPLVLVCAACHKKKLPLTWRLTNSRNSFVSQPGAEKSMVRLPEDSASGEDLLSESIVVFLLSPHSGQWESCQSLAPLQGC